MKIKSTKAAMQLTKEIQLLLFIIVIVIDLADARRFNLRENSASSIPFKTSFVSASDYAPLRRSGALVSFPVAEMSGDASVDGPFGSLDSASEIEEMGSLLRAEEQQANLLERRISTQEVEPKVGDAEQESPVSSLLDREARASEDLVASPSASAVTLASVNVSIEATTSSPALSPLEKQTLELTTPNSVQSTTSSTESPILTTTATNLITDINVTSTQTTTTTTTSPEPTQSSQSSSSNSTTSAKLEEDSQTQTNSQQQQVNKSFSLNLTGEPVSVTTAKSSSYTTTSAVAPSAPSLINQTTTTNSMSSLAPSSSPSAQSYELQRQLQSPEAGRAGRACGSGGCSGFTVVAIPTVELLSPSKSNQTANTNRTRIVNEFVFLPEPELNFEEQPAGFGAKQGQNMNSTVDSKSLKAEHRGIPDELGSDEVELDYVNGSDNNNPADLSSYLNNDNNNKLPTIQQAAIVTTTASSLVPKQSLTTSSTAASPRITTTTTTAAPTSRPTAPIPGLKVTSASGNYQVDTASAARAQPPIVRVSHSSSFSVSLASTGSSQTVMSTSEPIYLSSSSLGTSTSGPEEVGTEQVSTSTTNLRRPTGSRLNQKLLRLSALEASSGKSSQSGAYRVAQKQAETSMRPSQSISTTSRRPWLAAQSWNVRQVGSPNDKQQQPHRAYFDEPLGREPVRRRTNKYSHASVMADDEEAKILTRYPISPQGLSRLSAGSLSRITTTTTTTTTTTSAPSSTTTRGAMKTRAFPDTSSKIAAGDLNSHPQPADSPAGSSEALKVAGLLSKPTSASFAIFSNSAEQVQASNLTMQLANIRSPPPATSTAALHRNNSTSTLTTSTLAPIQTTTGKPNAPLATLDNVREERMTLIAASANLNDKLLEPATQQLVTQKAAQVLSQQPQSDRSQVVAGASGSSSSTSSTRKPSKQPVVSIERKQLKPLRVEPTKELRKLSDDVDEYEGSVEDQLATDALHHRPAASSINANPTSRTQTQTQRRSITNAYSNNLQQSASSSKPFNSPSTNTWQHSAKASDGNTIHLDESTSSAGTDDSGSNSNIGDNTSNHMPGRHGVDYPVHWQVPKTSFDCRNYDQSGFYADVESDCQAYHSCHKGRGGRHTFLCPNGTLFSQELLTCDWWYNVECSASKLYLKSEESKGLNLNESIRKA